MLKSKAMDSEHTKPQPMPSIPICSKLSSWSMQGSQGVRFGGEWKISKLGYRTEKPSLPSWQCCCYLLLPQNWCVDRRPKSSAANPSLFLPQEGRSLTASALRNVQSLERSSPPNPAAFLVAIALLALLLLLTIQQVASLMSVPSFLLTNLEFIYSHLPHSVNQGASVKIVSIYPQPQLETPTWSKSARVVRLPLAILA